MVQYYISTHKKKIIENDIFEPQYNIIHLIVN